MIWALIIAVVFIKPAKSLVNHYEQIEDKRYCVDWAVKCEIFNASHMIQYDCYRIQMECLKHRRTLRESR